MATFLTTRKMSPELAARVEASVRGRRVGPGVSLAPYAVSLLRLGIIGAVLTVTVWVVLHRQRAQQQLESERAALLESVRHESATLSPDQRAVTHRAMTWIQRCSGAYAGDWVADALANSTALAATLAEPILYLRGSLPGLQTQAGIQESAAASFKDAFVLCLLEPPESKTERALLGRVRSAHAGGERMQQVTADVHRTQHALLGIPFLTRAFQASVVAAQEQRELDKLARDFQRAPIEQAKNAARARLFLLVIDEPSDRPGPAELDGERAHPVRVNLVDLASEQLLLRLRRPVDPAWLSEGVRAEYAQGIDSCALALDVHAALSADLGDGAL